jgi:proline dehydrogenase
MLRRFLRTSLISLSKAGWARKTAMGLGFTRRFARRFIAGETLDEAITVIQQLNDRGIQATLDFLGESTTSADEARAATTEIIRALEAIDKSGVRANVSIKLSQFGLVLDQELCRTNLRAILARAKELGNFVRIDMEDSSLTDATIAMWSWACDQGLDNVGIVIQAYLYRSEADINRILERGGRVRLCKGAYDEPAAVAFPAKKDVDANYDQLARLLMEGALNLGSPQVSTDGHVPPIPAIASHDELRIHFAQGEIKRLGLPRGAVEFQMLYGIRRELQEALVAQGHPVRVYVPYGTFWYPYFMRRLAERPENIWFIVSNFFKK